MKMFKFLLCLLMLYNKSAMEFVKSLTIKNAMLPATNASNDINS